MTKKTNSIQGFPRKYDESELKQRQEGYRDTYRTSDQCTEIVRQELPYEFLAAVIEMASKGYTVVSKYPIWMSNMDHRCSMLKPTSVQEEDLKALDERIRQQYVEELQKELEEYRQKLTQQLIDADEEKEQKRIEAAKAKRLADIQAEVDNVFKSVVIPE